MADFGIQLAEIRGRRDQIEESLFNKGRELKRAELRGKSIELAQALLQQVAKETQDNLTVHLEDVCQMALDLCFPGEYTFHVKFELKSGKSVCEMYLRDENNYKYDPLSANGGGLADILSLGLRVAVWSLYRSDNIMVLDEPFKWPDATLKPLAGELLKQLSEKLGIQFLIVTHDEELMEIADRTFTVKKNRKGIAKVRMEEAL